MRSSGRFPCVRMVTSFFLFSRTLHARPKSPKNTSSVCCRPGSLAMVSSTNCLTFWASSGLCPNTCSSSKQSYSMTCDAGAKPKHWPSVHRESSRGSTT